MISRMGSFAILLIKVYSGIGANSGELQVIGVMIFWIVVLYDCLFVLQTKTEVSGLQREVAS